ncbi:MAG: glycoside hydrolase family 3 N-terminal domain-containing protein [Opitutales bacterium]
MDYLNPDLPLETRLDDLIGRMTIEEKCGQLRHEAPALERLGLPEYNWWNEALHGVGRNGRATVFPQPIGMAASWDPELVETVAAAVSDEARAKHHEAVRHGTRKQYQGLTFWTPNINIFRDPRWGRGMETWGEDPFLTGEMGTAFVRGLQGDDPEYLKTSACAKHFAVHSGPEGARHGFDACPPKEDFWNTYLPAFQKLVEAGVESVMPAYNRTYGEPCAGSYLLLRDILRGRWGFRGHVVSDCWAIKDFHKDHGVTNNAEESAALAVKAGTDLNCGTVYCESLLDAFKLRLVEEADIDRALRRVLRTRFKLGMFDPEERVPYAAIPLSVVGCEAHRSLAAKAAAESFVLLKNRNAALPLPERPKRMMVMGPNASNIDVMLGNYYGLSDRVSSLLEGIVGRVPEGVEIDYRPGFGHSEPNRNPVDWTSFEATRRDYVILAMGITPLMEGEEGDAIQSADIGDRGSIELPQVQVDFVTALRRKIDDPDYNRGNRPEGATRLIVLLFGGGPIACPEVHEAADAVLQVWYPGEAGGEAIAEVLWGDRSPGGKLPVTVPRSTAVLPPFEDYAMTGRGYRGMRAADILYPFGFGLGYGEVVYSGLEVPETHDGGGELRVRVTLENRGDRTVRETPQAYLSGESFAEKLVGFANCRLEAGARRTVEIILPREAWFVYDESGAERPLRGAFTLTVGPASCGERARELGAPAGVSGRLRLG